jgi:predicted nucleic acid-binding protein
MNSALDTNVVLAFLEEFDANHEVAVRFLEAVYNTGRVVMLGAVYAELVASPKRYQSDIDTFLERTGTELDWQVSEQMWRAAGAGYKAFTLRRIASGGTVPRRMLTDFVIGAHALEHGLQLVTLDNRFQRAAFPKLRTLGLQNLER